VNKVDRSFSQGAYGLCVYGERWSSIQIKQFFRVGIKGHHGERANAGGLGRSLKRGRSEQWPQEQASGPGTMRGECCCCTGPEGAGVCGTEGWFRGCSVELMVASPSWVDAILRGKL
jgi:hypothetical protein